MMWYILILFGLISGLIGGMGMGGGTLLVPLLTIFLGFSQITSQAINLLAFLPMSLFAIFVHLKNGLIKGKYTILIAICGVIFAILGSFIASFFDQILLKKLFGIFLMILSIWEFIKIFKK